MSSVGRGFEATVRGSATGYRVLGEVAVRGTRPHCGPPVRYLRIALRDKTLPHCGGKRPHCGKNRPQCGVKIDRTAVRDDRTAVGKSTALRSDSTALRRVRRDIDRTAVRAALLRSPKLAQAAARLQPSARSMPPTGSKRTRTEAMAVSKRDQIISA